MIRANYRMISTNRRGERIVTPAYILMLTGEPITLQWNLLSGTLLMRIVRHFSDQSHTLLLLLFYSLSLEMLTRKCAVPWQLSEGIAMGAMGPRDGLQPIVRHVDKQILSLHPFYTNAQLVRSPFRTFHRSDGFLLSLSPMAGINYLDKNFKRHLSEPLDALFDNDDASAVGHVFQAFAEQGTKTWHRKTVEWLLVYLITEVGVTPHNFRQGGNAPAFESAYSSVIQDLKRRRYDQWKPKVTVELVRAFLSGIDELTAIKLILQKKVELFKIMQLDVKKFEIEDSRFSKTPVNSEGEPAGQRLKWAINTVQGQHECFERLLIDLKQSMDAVSITQST